MLLEAPAMIDAILSIVREQTGADFSRYRRATIERRIRNRMVSAGVSSLDEYVALLQAGDGEAERLLERLTIKVSEFYRNPLAFDVLRHEVLPVLAQRRHGTPAMMWCAGCGCGEEAYTLAMLLDAVVGAGHVVATDVDPGAVAQAERAVYPRSAISPLPPDLAARYVERDPASAAGDSVRVCDAIRRRVRFEVHDVLSAAPPPGGGPFDLVSCRNVLIYFSREAHEPTLRRLVAAMAPGGCLCLGEAEWPSASVMPLFEPLGHRSRVFRLKDEPRAGGAA